MRRGQHSLELILSEALKVTSRPVSLPRTTIPCFDFIFLAHTHTLSLHHSKSLKANTLAQRHNTWCSCLVKISQFHREKIISDYQTPLPLPPRISSLCLKADYEAFWNELKAKRGQWTTKSRHEAVKKRWPDKDDRLGYLEWAQRRADKALEQYTAPVSRSDLLQMIANMNHNSEIDRAKLVTALEQSIVPRAYELQPDRMKPNTDREIVSLNVLGVNTNVQTRTPRQSRRANLSEESTISK